MKKEYIPLNIDYQKRHSEVKSILEEDEKRYKREVKEEENRVKKLSCPACKSKDKEIKVISESNGVIGPGYHSSVKLDFYVCKKCGIHFSDLNKKEIKPMMNRNLMFY